MSKSKITIAADSPIWMNPASTDDPLDQLDIPNDVNEIAREARKISKNEPKERTRLNRKTRNAR